LGEQQNRNKRKGVGRQQGRTSAAAKLEAKLKEA
jgi:hypothetical protein